MNGIINGPLKAEGCSLSTIADRRKWEKAYIISLAPPASSGRSNTMAGTSAVTVNICVEIIMSVRIMCVCVRVCVCVCVCV